MISKQQGVTNGGGMTPPSDRRANCAMRDLVSVAQRHQKHTRAVPRGPFFMRQQRADSSVALRVIVGRNQSGSEGCIRTK
jgi:hypothetical protein